jgi:hypothetical protein
MKVFLLHPDHDFKVKQELWDPIFVAMLSGDLFAVTNARRNLEREREKNPEQYSRRQSSDDALSQDLELSTLWAVMAAEDEFLYEMAKRGTLSSLTDPDEIRYRQHILADCLQHPEPVKQIYALALEALGNEKQVGGFWSGAGPDRILSRSVQILKLHLDVLKRLRQLADEHAGAFRSEGFSRFFAMLQEELSDEYLQSVEHHLNELEFKRGTLESAKLTKGFKGHRYIVRTQRSYSWRERLLPGNRPPGYSFTIPPRDENGFKALEEIRGKGLNKVANAAAQSADHIKSFFSMLRLELAFYLGCLNLHERLDAKGEPTCFPTVLAAEQTTFTAEELYDVSLTMHLDDRVVGNSINGENKALVVITGANQGGKSTFLRSVGLAQVMLQCGMFVGAESLQANVCSGVFTHYKREEDEEMESGKLDEELRRMSAIADEIKPRALLLCNESFASTNEREGSEIARQVVRAMLDKKVKVFFVTHMYDLAHGFHVQGRDDAIFLRAERQDDGSRTFKLAEREPLPTSYGEDSYRRIFGARTAGQDAPGRSRVASSAQRR